MNTHAGRLSRPGRAVLGVLLGAAVVVPGALPAPAAADGPVCWSPNRLFAVDAQSGHLDEIGFCADTGRLAAPVEVDSGDWRGYAQLTADRDSTDRVVLYAVTAAGGLEVRRQAAPGAPLSPPVNVAPAVDWLQFRSVFATHSGYLHALDTSSVRTFRIDGATLTESSALLPTFRGPSMSAAHWGRFGEGNHNGTHFRIWQAGPSANGTVEHDDAWFPSGLLPAGITGITGAEPFLFGLDGTGSAVVLTQPRPRPEPPRKVWDCPLNNDLGWQVATVRPGNFAKLVAPANDSSTGSVAVLAPASQQHGIDCDSSGLPYEWQ